MTCFGRDQESARLWRYFKNGKNVLMLAPRRIGKTVLLNRLKEESESHGYHAIVLDVEGYRDEKAFFRQMCAAIQEEIGVGQAVITGLTERLKRIVQGVESQGDWRNILLDIDWTVFADHLLAQLEAEKDGKSWLFLVDEIPIFTKALLEKSGPEKTHDFLYTLRNLRQKHPKVIWLYTGSIGMDTVARRSGLEGALVDMEIYPLEPFSPKTAADFLAHIAKKNQYTFTVEAIDIVLNRLGWLSPYYLEKVAEAACDKVVDNQQISVEAANLAADSLLELARRTYWSTWREHLDKNFPDPERTHLFTILAEIAHAPTTANIDLLLTALNRVGEPIGEKVLRGYLDTLEADGYLLADDSRSQYHFRMNLLREWWLRYVVLGEHHG
jgi:AAA+ ATPase superfamily predicted ATPase